MIFCEKVTGTARTATWKLIFALSYFPYLHDLENYLNSCWNR